MGFFQDLKEDLSQAVGELLPEEETGVTFDDTQEDTSVDAALKEVEEALAAELGEQVLPREETPSDVEEAVSEAVSLQKPEADEPEVEEAEEPEADGPGTDEEVHAKPQETMQTEKAEQPGENAPVESQTVQKQASQPVVEAAAAQIASIAGMVAKEEPALTDLSAADDAAYEERSEQPIEQLLAGIQDVTIEETEIEKEVGKVLEKQKMNLADEAVCDETAIITGGMEITGDIVSKGSMDIQGSIHGNLEILGKLNVSGKITGDSKAAEVFADSANITRKIVADGTVKIGENSVVIGNIEATSAVIAGAVKGDLDVHGPVILDTSAIVMGNIKSKSVQINNGAVIEGMCSQCYAEVFDSLIAK